MKLLIEVFTSLPPCSGGRIVKKMMREIEKKYGERVEIKIYEGKSEKAKEYGIETTPAIVIDRDIRFSQSISSAEDTLSSCVAH